MLYPAELRALNCNTPHSVLQHGVYVLIHQLRPAVESDEFNQKLQSNDLTAKRADEVDGRTGRAARGEQVVDDEHTGAVLDGIGMNLQRVGAVLE